VRLRSGPVSSRHRLQAGGELWCRRSRLNGFVIIEVGGEIDLHTAPAFRDEMLAAIAEDSPHLIVDLAEITFMDASGLSALVDALHRSRARGGSVGLAAPTSGLRKVLGITQLDRVFPVHDTLCGARRHTPLEEADRLNQTILAG
jgi:anti-sigma B factor antagonist